MNLNIFNITFSQISYLIVYLPNIIDYFSKLKYKICVLYIYGVLIQSLFIPCNRDLRRHIIPENVSDHRNKNWFQAIQLVMQNYHRSSFHNQLDNIRVEHSLLY